MTAGKEESEMRLIKNFLHNINDIVLAVIIVALAAGIIYWRMQIILDYPKQLADQQAEYQQEQAEEQSAGAETEEADEAAAAESDAAEEPAENAEAAEEPADNTEAAEQPQG